MNIRFQRYKKKTGYTNDQLAEQFGVSPVTIINWLYAKSQMSPDCLQTLGRFEEELNRPPKPAFTEGRHAKSA